MSEIADSTKTSAAAKGAETKPVGDKIDPTVTLQQLGAPAKTETTTGTTAEKPADKAADKPGEKPSGAAIETHVSQQQLGQDALRIIKQQKPALVATGLERVQLIGDDNKPVAKAQPEPVEPKSERPRAEPKGERPAAETPEPGQPRAERPAEQPPTEQPKPEAPRLSAKELEAMADAINNAANGGFFGTGTDKDAINEQLKRLKNPREREALDEIYRKKVGHGIEDELRDELSGSDLDKSLALWKPTNIDAARVHVALTEHKEWGLGARSNAAVERDLRDTVSTMNFQQIAEMDKAYQNEHGISVREAVLNDPDLPQSTKEALKIYFKGADNRTTQDTLDLADLALKERNLDMMQEAFRAASPEARATFLQNGGEQKIKESFGTAYSTGDEFGAGETVYTENDTTRQALDYVRTGQLDTATKIKLNTGIINDNEDAIKLTIATMTDEQRRSYQNGAALAEKPEAGLTPEERQDRSYYKELRSALESAGNERELREWEDLIRAKDGTLVTRLAQHGGLIDDGIGDVLKTIEDMSKEDWERLKHDPKELQRVTDVLAIDLSESELTRATELLKQKIEAPDYVASQSMQRSIDKAIDDNIGFFNTDENGLFDSISRMTKTEQEQYRTDPLFKQKIDAAVLRGMDIGNEQQAAFAKLDAITRGDDPKTDIISKFYVHADHLNTDEAAVIADLETAFKEDPKLRERLKNDPEYRKSFDTAIRAALDPGEYDRYAKPLIEQGRLPMAVKAELYNGFFNDDEKGVWDAIGKGSEEDFKEIIANPDGVLPFLSEEERQVAVILAEQKGQMRPEDKIRSSMLGAGTTEGAIHEALKDLTSEQVEQVRAEYLRKYGSDMLGDALSEMGGTDREKVVDKAGALPETSREEFNRTRDAVYKSVDGVGRWFVNNLDGTGHMTDDELNKYAAGMTKYAQAYEDMPLEQRTKFKEDLLKAKELYGKSENSAADLVVDGAIIGAGVLGAKFTGGVSLSLLAYTSFGGALFKIGAKSAIVGNDYDFASADTMLDGATGAIDAATIFLGPAQAAQMLKLGGKSAETASVAVIKHAEDVMRTSGKQLLKDGAEERLQKRLSEEIAFAISNGANEVDQKAIARLAKEFSPDPADVPQMTGLIRESLSAAIAQEGSTALRTQMRELGLNSLAGNVGGGLSGGVYGFKDLDESRSATDNFFQILQSGGTGSLFGTGMAAGFTVGFKGLGKTFTAFRGVDSAPHINGSSTPEVAPDLSLASRTSGTTLPDLRVTEDGVSGRELDAETFFERDTREPGAVMSRSDTPGVPAEKPHAEPDVAAPSSDIEDPSSRFRTELPEPRADINGRRFISGDHVQTPEGAANLLGYDGQTGKAIVQMPDRKHWAIQMRQFDNSDGRYKPITIEGEQRWYDERGFVYDMFDLGPGRKGIAIAHQYRLLPPDSLKAPSVEQVKLQLAEDRAVRDAVTIPKPTPDAVTAPRVEAPEVPARTSPRFPRVHHDTNLYDGAVLSLNGRQLGGELRADGAPIDIGRSAAGKEILGSDLNVSGHHGSVKWDPNEQMYYLEERSTNGSFIKRAGEDHYTHAPGGKNGPYKIYIGPNDSIRLGTADGPEIKLTVAGGESMKPPPGPRGDQDVRIFFDGRPLQPDSHGTLMIGRQYQSFGNESASDILNRRVAREHATLQWDERAQKWLFTDLTEAHRSSPGMENATIQVRQQSGNGTYIKREDGTVDFVQSRSTLLGPNDRIFLGSPDGPELKFITNTGFRQPDGRVVVPRKNLDTAIKRPDGTTEIITFLNYRRIEDPHGNVLRTLTPGGDRRAFTYNRDKSLATIKFDDDSVASIGKDGTWVRTTPDGKETPFWNGKITVDSEGGIHFIDNGRPPMRTVERVDGVREVHHPNGRVEYRNIDFHQELGAMNLISNTFANREQAARFKTMMNNFERRANSEGIPRQEQAEFFFHARRLVSAETGAFLTATERIKVAEQLLNIGSNPRICQGANSTCNVATVEQRMFERKPSEAARLISDVVITGKYVTADGTKIDLSRIPGVLNPDAESRMLLRLYSPDGRDLAIDGRRPYVSQIFETTAVNVKWANEKSLRPGEIMVYEKPQTKGPKTSKASNEELVKYSVNDQGVLERQVVKTSPHITGPELTDIYNRIAGTNERNFVITNSPRRFGPREDGSYAVNSPQALHDAILAVKRDNNGPAILLVHTGNEPFFTDSGLKAAKGAIAGGAGGPGGGWHVINVHNTFKDPKTGKIMVEFTNQWGSNADHMGARAVPLDQLYKATMDPNPGTPAAFPVREEAAASRLDRQATVERNFDAHDAPSSTAAQIVGDNDPKGGLWWPKRHFDDLSSDDRDVLFGMLNGRQSPLSEPEFTYAFTERALPTFNSWSENFKPMFKEMKEAQDTVLEYRAQIAEMIDELPMANYRELEANKPLLLEHFQDDYRKIQAINTFFDARQRNFELHEKISEALEPRRQQLQDMANDIVAQFKTADGTLAGIPPVRVEVVSPQHMGSAVATYGDGVIRINQAELLNNKSVADLLGTVYHELTHNEQQTTILRALADELKIGAKPTDEQIDLLIQKYSERAGRRVSEDYTRQVMVLRNGVELPRSAQERATALMEAFDRNQPVGQEWKELGNSYRRIQREIPRLEGKREEKSVAARIIESLSGSAREQNSLRLFGKREVPPELNQYIVGLRRFMNGNDDAWNNNMEMEARRVMLRLMNDHVDSINNRRRELYERYMQFHEYDAWLSGERARRAAISNGATFRDPNNSLWEEMDWLQ